MKLLRSLLLLLSFAAFLSACQKEVSLEHATLVSNSQWEFKDSAVQFRGPIDTAYLASTGPLNSLILRGTSVDGQGEIFIQLFGNTPIAKGTYSNPAVLFNYIIGGALYYENVPTNTGRFSVTVSTLDSQLVEGTFSGEVLDLLGNTRTIREGKFKGYFEKATVPPPPAGNGQLMLWAKQGCSGAPIRVIVGGQEKSITAFQAVEPICGATGTALYVLPAGQHSWIAICGTDTIRGTVGITGGACIRAEVSFQPGLHPACKLSEFTAYDLATNTLLFSNKSFFNSNHQVNKIQMIDASDPANGTFEYNLAYETNKITIQEGRQHFELDVAGRVIKFFGHLSPTDQTSARVVFTYTYDVSGRMVRSTIALEVNPNQPIFESLHTWTNGNLTKVVIKEIGAMNERTEIDYEYDLTKITNKFLLFYINEELNIFQTAINTGLNSVNAVSKSTVRDYDAAGTVTPFDVANFSDYTIDANHKYVQRFSISNGASVYGGDVRYQLGYECF